MTRVFLRSCALMASFVFASGSAKADWVEASSDHFVIYGDQDAETVRSFAERLELFHAAMTKLMQSPQSKPSPSNRVTIFSVATEARVRETVGDGNPFLAGYYDARAGGSFALVPKLKSASKIQRDLSSEQQMVNDERWADAAKTLAPLAYSPHPGEHTDQALQLLKEVEAKADPVAAADPGLKSSP